MYCTGKPVAPGEVQVIATPGTAVVRCYMLQVIAQKSWELLFRLKETWEFPLEGNKPARALPAAKIFHWALES